MEERLRKDDGLMQESRINGLIVKAKNGNLTEVEIVQALLDIVTEKSYLEKQIKDNEHKVDFYDAVADSDDLTEMSMVAKVINISGYGRNKLFEFLREKKILRYNNEPYQQYVDHGYFKPIEQQVTLPYGNTIINKKTMVTQRGIDFIRKIING